MLPVGPLTQHTQRRQTSCSVGVRVTSNGRHRKQLALAGGGVVGEGGGAGAGRQLLDAVRLAHLQATVEAALHLPARSGVCWLKRDACMLPVYSTSAVLVTVRCSPPVHHPGIAADGSCTLDMYAHSQWAA